MSDAPKMKLHYLVKLIVKDPTIDRIVINTVGVCRRLDEMHRRQQEAIARKTSNDELVNHAINLVLLKFNRYAID